MTWAIIWMTLFGPEIDAFFVDQLSFPVLVLRILYGQTFRIMFYCHFPDSLCDPNKPFDASCLLEEQEERAPLSLYTKFLNYIDKYCMACADTIVYNSDFTKCVTEKCFGTDFDGKTLVLRPAFGLRTKRRTLTISDQTCSQLNMLDNFTKLPPALTSKSSKTFCIVCISCFEPRKNHILALQMLEHIFAVQKVLAKKGVRKNPPKVHLVLAGGYDSRRLDNVRCMRSLLEAINENTRQHVSILPNISDDLKWGLLHRADAVVFTPVNEPFGIVPLEAMSCGKPVIACNFGGPVETIGLTHEHGILLDPDPEKFAEAMLVLINNEKLRHEMGWDAQEHVEDEFILQDLCGNFWFHLFED